MKETIPQMINFYIYLTILIKKIKKYLIYKAHETSLKHYNNKVYLRGLIEFTNYCKNACLYCGISCNNNNAERYRLSEEEILNCCKKGYSLGYRTFVLQGGEDPYYTDNKIIDIIKSIKKIISKLCCNIIYWRKKLRNI